MLTREATSELLAKLKEDGYELAQVRSEEDGAAAIFCGKKCGDAVQEVVDWMGRRGNSEEALTEFVTMFQFDNRDLAVARVQARSGLKEAVGRGRPADNASIAATLVSNWLNYAAMKTGNSSIEYDCIRLCLQRSEYTAAMNRLCQMIVWAVLAIGGAFGLFAMLFSLL